MTTSKEIPTLDSLDESTSSLHLLAILHQLRNEVGSYVIDQAVAKVMGSSCPQQFLHRKKPKRQEKKTRAFDMTKYQTRHVAMKFLYLGEKYAGFARQDHMPETVERYLFDALKRTKMIQDIESCNYSRCGRTDRGVSAFGQVIGITVRSNLPAQATLLDFESIDQVHPGQRFRVQLENGSEKLVQEMEYATQLNRALPQDIRVYSVVAAPSDFNARFHATCRVYRYFFVNKSRDVALMRKAAKLLEGHHDYRNFCRIDTNAHTFERFIKSFNVISCGLTADATAGASQAQQERQVFCFEIEGSSFLWHQVRCMVHVLFLIGEGKEDISIIDKLFDIESNPRKPQYDMAPDLPLVLHDCRFDNVQFDHFSPLALYHVHEELSQRWEEHMIKAAILRSNLDAIESFQVLEPNVVDELDHFKPKLEQLLKTLPSCSQHEQQEDDTMNNNNNIRRLAWKDVAPLLPLANRRRGHIPILQRDTGLSVAEKKQKMNERKRRREEADAEAMASPPPAAAAATSG